MLPTPLCQIALLSFLVLLCYSLSLTPPPCKLCSLRLKDCPPHPTPVSQIVFSPPPSLSLCRPPPQPPFSLSLRVVSCVVCPFLCLRLKASHACLSPSAPLSLTFSQIVLLSVSLSAPLSLLTPPHSVSVLAVVYNELRIYSSVSGQEMDLNISEI